MKFTVGMLIEGEVGHVHGQMRWGYRNNINNPTAMVLTDSGYTGIIAKGIVTKIYEDSHTIDCDFIYPPPNDYILWSIAIEGNPAYDPNQWNLPGFIRPVERTKTAKKCSCGSDKTYGKSNGAHSHWCDLNNK